MAGNVHGEGKSFPGAIDDAGMKVLARREGDGMEKEIQLSPALAQGVEDRLKLALLPEVTRHDYVRAKAFRQWPHMGLRPFVEVGDGDIRAHFPERLGAAVGNAVRIGDAHNEAALSLERKQSHGVPPSNGRQRTHPAGGFHGPSLAGPVASRRFHDQPAWNSASQSATILQTSACRNPATVTGTAATVTGAGSLAHMSLCLDFGLTGYRNLLPPAYEDTDPGLSYEFAQ